MQRLWHFVWNLEDSVCYFGISFLYLRERKRKLEFGLAAVRADGDLSAVQVDDILDDVQTEACAGLVHRTRTIRLVEAVEHVRQILGGNACAGVRDGERTEVALRMGAERQPAALVDELHLLPSARRRDIVK